MVILPMSLSTTRLRNQTVLKIFLIEVLKAKANKLTQRAILENKRLILKLKSLKVRSFLNKMKKLRRKTSKSKTNSKSSRKEKKRERRKILRIRETMKMMKTKIADFPLLLFQLIKIWNLTFKLNETNSN